MNRQTLNLTDTTTLVEGLPLHVAGLEVRSPRGRLLLSVPALDVEPGLALGIRGPSGAGKSTLLFAIAGLLNRVSGRIAWGGMDYSGMTPAARAAFRADNMGIVFQDFLLFEELGALANVAIPALYRPSAERGAIRNRAAALLTRFGLKGELDRPVPSLSGGERQRVAVVRALAAEPRILLADEPTANLDREAGESLVRDLVARVRAHRITLVVASHDEKLLAAMDRVVTIRNGAMEDVHA